MPGGRAGLGARQGRPVLCALIEEPIKQPAEMIGEPIRGRVKTGPSRSSGSSAGIWTLGVYPNVCASSPSVEDYRTFGPASLRLLDSLLDGHRACDVYKLDTGPVLGARLDSGGRHSMNVLPLLSSLSNRN